MELLSSPVLIKINFTYRDAKMISQILSMVFFVHLDLDCVHLQHMFCPFPRRHYPKKSIHQIQFFFFLLD